MIKDDEKDKPGLVSNGTFRSGIQRIYFIRLS